MGTSDTSEYFLMVEVMKVRERVASWRIVNVDKASKTVSRKRMLN